MTRRTTQLGISKWKNLAGTCISSQATPVRDRNFVNVAPLQFGEERWLLAHGFAGAEGNCTLSF